MNADSPRTVCRLYVQSGGNSYGLNLLGRADPEAIFRRLEIAQDSSSFFAFNERASGCGGADFDPAGL